MWTALFLSLPLAAAPPPAEITVPVSVPVDVIERALTNELRRSGRDVLDDFQVVTSKFHRGRIVVTGLEIEPTARRNRLRVRGSAKLVFRRKQLGVKWRGLKSRKTWEDRGKEVVARVRVDGRLTVVPTLDRRLGDASLDFRLSDLRLHVDSTLRPVQWLDFSVRLRDRTERWDVPEDTPRFLRAMELVRLDVVPVVRRGKTARVDVTVGLRRQHELLPRHGDAAEHE